MRGPLKNVMAKHPAYKEFAIYLKQESAVSLKANSITNILQQLKAMRNKHNLDLDNPDAKAVLITKEKKGIATATMNLRRYFFKMWLLYKGMKPPNRRILKAKRTNTITSDTSTKSTTNLKSLKNQILHPPIGTVRVMDLVTECSN